MQFSRILLSVAAAAGLATAQASDSQIDDGVCIVRGDNYVYTNDTAILLTWLGEGEGCGLFDTTTIQATVINNTGSCVQDMAALESEEIAPFYQVKQFTPTPLFDIKLGCTNNTGTNNTCIGCTNVEDKTYGNRKENCIGNKYKVYDTNSIKNCSEPAQAQAGANRSWSLAMFNRTVSIPGKATDDACSLDGSRLGVNNFATYYTVIPTTNCTRLANRRDDNTGYYSWTNSTGSKCFKAGCNETCEGCRVIQGPNCGEPEDTKDGYDSGVLKTGECYTSINSAASINCTDTLCRFTAFYLFEQAPRGAYVPAAPSTSDSDGVPVGAILGGVFGALALGGIIFFVLQRRKLARTNAYAPLIQGKRDVDLYSE